MNTTHLFATFINRHKPLVRKRTGFKPLKSYTLSVSPPDRLVGLYDSVPFGDNISLKYSFIGVLPDQMVMVENRIVDGAAEASLSLLEMNEVIFTAKCNQEELASLGNMISLNEENINSIPFKILVYRGHLVWSSSNPDELHPQHSPISEAWIEKFFVYHTYWTDIPLEKCSENLEAILQFIQQPIFSENSSLPDFSLLFEYFILDGDAPRLCGLRHLHVQQLRGIDVSHKLEWYRESQLVVLNFICNKLIDPLIASCIEDDTTRSKVEEMMRSLNHRSEVWESDDIGSILEYLESDSSALENHESFFDFTMSEKIYKANKESFQKSLEEMIRGELSGSWWLENGILFDGELMTEELNMALVEKSKRGFTLVDVDQKVLYQRNTKPTETKFVRKNDFDFVFLWNSKDPRANIKIEWFPVVDPSKCRQKELDGSIVKGSFNNCEDYMVFITKHELKCPSNDSNSKLVSLNYFKLDTTKVDVNTEDILELWHSHKKTVSNNAETSSFLRIKANNSVAINQFKCKSGFFNNWPNLPAANNQIEIFVKKLHMDPCTKQLVSDGWVEYETPSCLKSEAGKDEQKKTVELHHVNLAINRLFCCYETSLGNCRKSEKQAIESSMHLISFIIRKSRLEEEARLDVSKLYRFSKRSKFYVSTYPTKQAIIFIMATRDQSRFALVTYKDRKFQHIAKHPKSIDIPPTIGCRPLEKASIVKFRWNDKKKTLRVLISEKKQEVKLADVHLFDLKLIL